MIAVEVIEHVANPVQALTNLIAAANEGLWISTPNGQGKPVPPSNPYHVAEYSPSEMLDMLFANERVSSVYVWAWDKFPGQPAIAFREQKDPMPSSDPLVYHANLRPR